MAAELLVGQSSPPEHDPGSSTAVYNFWKGDIFCLYTLSRALKRLLGALMITMQS